MGFESKKWASAPRVTQGFEPLIWNGRIDNVQFALRRKRLEHFAWCAPEVWEYADNITAAAAAGRRG